MEVDRPGVVVGSGCVYLLYCSVVELNDADAVMCCSVFSVYFDVAH